ncbi:MAG: hypothetical protein QW290_07070 [Sulfolobales archaeon]
MYSGGYGYDSEWLTIIGVKTPTLATASFFIVFIVLTLMGWLRD